MNKIKIYSHTLSKSVYVTRTLNSTRTIRLVIETEDRSSLYLDVSRRKSFVVDVLKGLRQNVGQFDVDYVNVSRLDKDGTRCVYDVFLSDSRNRPIDLYKKYAKIGYF